LVLENNEQDCECKNWASYGIPPFLSHHERCKKYDPARDYVEIVNSLIMGIESWSTDCDGIHPDIYDAYKKAKVSLGQFDFIKKEI
jgi:hypothetical protein